MKLYLNRSFLKWRLSPMKKKRIWKLTPRELVLLAAFIVMFAAWLGAITHTRVVEKPVFMIPPAAPQDLHSNE